MFWEIFEHLCAQRGSTPTALSTEMGFSNATATKWKKGSLPQAAALLTIGEFFDVSIDYLLGRTDIPEVNRPAPQLHQLKIAARGGGVKARLERAVHLRLSFSLSYRIKKTVMWMEVIA